MDARAALQAGDVRRTMELLKDEVRQAPRDARLRTFLFQLFCVTGEWDRALNQLALAGTLDPACGPMVQTYEIAIRCEVLRDKIFRGQCSPTVLGEPGPWFPLLIEATRLLATGEPGRAAQLRDQAFDQAPPRPATLDGIAVEWVADADPRLGPAIEAIVDGRYVWIPYDRIATITQDPPQDLRDQVWMPARFTWTNDGNANGLIPTRYPGTTAPGVTASPDDALLLARRTDWIEQDGWSLPIGQRMLVTDAAETALMDLRRLQFDPG